jgi:subfamily B ATP-binding cassette protein HlyB/CyaB
MDQHLEYSFGNFFHDLLHYIRPYKLKFIAGVFLRFTSDVAHLYPIWAISQVVFLLTQPHTPDLLSSLLGIFTIWFGTLFYCEIVHVFAKYLGYQVAEASSLNLFKDCLAHIFKLDLAWQEIENSGNKMKRIEKGHDGMDEVIRRIFDVVIEVSVNTIGIFFIFLSLEKNISFSLVLFTVIYFLLGTYLIKRASQQEEIVNQSYENLSGLTFESLNNIHTIKSLAIDQGIIQTVSKQLTDLIRQIKKRIFLFQSRSGILNLFEVLFEFSIITAIVWGIWQGHYNISLLILFTGLFKRVSESTRELTEVTQQIILCKIWMSRAMAILHTQPEIENPELQKNQVAYPNNWKTLRIENLHFTYKKGQALENISLSIQRGEKVGIVGLSGAGKSTLFKLLLDLYESYEGDIRLDEVSFKKMSRQSYINHVSVVLQDTELFNMSLKENITIAAAPHNSSTSVEEVIQMAHLDDVVAKLSQGVETMIGEKGVKLSGGQRQRVGIARALYRQPDILLLDEATSHLDAHSEKLIQQALEECMHQFTMIVIAHRLSTIKKMDTIVVLEKGKVIEVGSFEKLIAQKGAFSRMWREQKI